MNEETIKMILNLQDAVLHLQKNAIETAEHISELGIKIRNLEGK